MFDAFVFVKNGDLIADSILRRKRTERISTDSRDFFPTFFDSNVYISRLVALYRFCFFWICFYHRRRTDFSRSSATSIARNVLSVTFWPAARNFFPTSEHAFTFVRYIDIRPCLVPIFRGDVRLSSVGGYKLVNFWSEDVGRKLNWNRRFLRRSLFVIHLIEWRSKDVDKDDLAELSFVPNLGPEIVIPRKTGGRNGGKVSFPLEK